MVDTPNEELDVMSEADRLKTDYEQTLSYFLSLHEVRFKLLEFLPIVTGVSIYFVPLHASKSVQFAVACLGLLVTLGLSSYDQRNTQIYDRLVRRLRMLEAKMKFASLYSKDPAGGAFHCRPAIMKVFRVKMVWHIQGLSIVYAAAFTGWSFIAIKALCNNNLWIGVLSALVFMICYALLRLVSKAHHAETKELDTVVANTRAGGV